MSAPRGWGRRKTDQETQGQRTEPGPLQNQPGRVVSHGAPAGGQTHYEHGGLVGLQF